MRINLDNGIQKHFRVFNDVDSQRYLVFLSNDIIKELSLMNPYLNNLNIAGSTMCYIWGYELDKNKYPILFKTVTANIPQPLNLKCGYRYQNVPYDFFTNYEIDSDNYFKFVKNSVIANLWISQQPYRDVDSGFIELDI